MASGCLDSKIASFQKRPIFKKSLIEIGTKTVLCYIFLNKKLCNSPSSSKNAVCDGYYDF